MSMVGTSVQTPDGVGTVIDHDWCDGDTGVGIKQSWVYDCVTVRFPDGSEDVYDVEDVSEVPEIPMAELVTDLIVKLDAAGLLAELEAVVERAHSARQRRG